jgi:hypothetical protein
MKRLFIALLLISFTICFSGCLSEEVSMLYSDTVEMDGFFIAINKLSNCCFVGSYQCTEYTENLEITIPDAYDGIPITRMGGYYGTGVPTPFLISLADLYMNAPENSKYNGVFSGNINDFEIAEAYIIENVVFHLNIGKNIEAIEFVSMDTYYPHINEDGSITFYHPVVYTNCSAENEHFYSKDGKLYNKETDELITVFDYVTT